jgi:hypothetical protein
MHPPGEIVRRVLAMTTERDMAHDGTRRQLLRLLGLAGGAAAVTIAAPEAAIAKAKDKKKGVVVYRLSARATSHCNACAKHHRRYAFLTHALADANRAHPGCNCPITTQEVRGKTFKALFPKGGSGVVRLDQEATGKSA